MVNLSKLWRNTTLKLYYDTKYGTSLYFKFFPPELSSWCALKCVETSIQTTILPIQNIWPEVLANLIKFQAQENDIYVVT